MSIFLYRYVGKEALPARLADFGPAKTRELN